MLSFIRESPDLYDLNSLVDSIYGGLLHLIPIREMQDGCNGEHLRCRSKLQTPGLIDIDPPTHSICGAKLMAINHYRNRHQNPLENDPSTSRSNTDEGRRLKVIRNHAYDPPAPAASGKGGDHCLLNLKVR